MQIIIPILVLFAGGAWCLFREIYYERLLKNNGLNVKYLGKRDLFMNIKRLLFIAGVIVIYVIAILR